LAKKRYYPDLTLEEQRIAKRFLQERLGIKMRLSQDNMKRIADYVTDYRDAREWRRIYKYGDLLEKKCTIDNEREEILKLLGLPSKSIGTIVPKIKDLVAEVHEFEENLSKAEGWINRRKKSMVAAEKLALAAKALCDMLSGMRWLPSARSDKGLVRDCQQKLKTAISKYRDEDPDSGG
jgi:hypothetical protein